MKFKSALKKMIIYISVFLIAIIAIILLADITISQSNKSRLYDDVSAIPENKVGLVLGTSKHIGNNINYYFKYRIDAVSELYKAGKIKYIVVSGDNSRKSYNEPLDMKNDLVAKGIPENVIYLDYAGFRTLDSVVRINKIFGQQQFTIVSQKFHNERAVYIAQYYGLNTYAYNAKDVNSRAGFKTNVREKFARVKVFIDIFTGKEPKFLGEEIEIK